jgi:beta-glucosidase
VQLYIRDLVSSVTRPVKELKGFKRVHLVPGETRSLELPVTPESLAFWDIDKQYRVEPGEFAMMVGQDSVNVQTTMLTVVGSSSRS